jgi:hypothetical protein
MIDFSDFEDDQETEECQEFHIFPSISNILPIEIIQLKKYNSNVKFNSFTNNSIRFTLPSSVLPLRLIIAFGFDCSDIL